MALRGAGFLVQDQNVAGVAIRLRLCTLLSLLAGRAVQLFAGWSLAWSFSYSRTSASKVYMAGERAHRTAILVWSHEAGPLNGKEHPPHLFVLHQHCCALSWCALADRRDGISTAVFATWRLKPHLFSSFWGPHIATKKNAHMDGFPLYYLGLSGKMCIDALSVRSGSCFRVGAV